MSSVCAIYVFAQILAINRGENLKILTVKVTIPDRVKDLFCRWCVNERSVYILTESFPFFFIFFILLLKCLINVPAHYRDTVLKQLKPY